jgi:hypothetical protein
MKPYLELGTLHTYPHSLNKKKRTITHGLASARAKQVALREPGLQNLAFCLQEVSMSKQLRFSDTTTRSIEEVHVTIDY